MTEIWNLNSNVKHSMIGCCKGHMTCLYCKKDSNWLLTSSCVKVLLWILALAHPLASFLSETNVRSLEKIKHNFVEISTQAMLQWFSVETMSFEQPEIWGKIL